MFCEGHFEKSQTAWDRIDVEKGLGTCTAAATVELKGYELRPSNERIRIYIYTEMGRGACYACYAACAGKCMHTVGE